MPASPTRRWFQFRLRTLLVGVALIGAACGYVAHEWRIVRERNALRDWLVANRAGDYSPYISWSSLPASEHPPPVSWVRQLMGDYGEIWIDLTRRASAKDEAKVRAVFPEAEIDRPAGFSMDPINTSSGRPAPQPAPAPATKS